jgi:hypothetical protein
MNKKRTVLFKLKTSSNDMTNAHKILVRKHEGKQSPGKHWCRSEDTFF